MNIKNENVPTVGDGDDAPAGFDGPVWLEACRREEAIRELLSRSDGERLKMNDVEEVALELGVSRATLYRLITIYRQTPTVEALEPRQRGRRKGTLFRRARHELIRKTIREVNCKPQRPTLANSSNKFTCVSRSRVGRCQIAEQFKARVDQIEKRLIARKRRDVAAIKATTPVPGHTSPSRPLEVIQIDPALVDLVVVHEETRGR